MPHARLFLDAENAFDDSEIPWSTEEEEKWYEAVKIHGKSYDKVASKMGTRTAL